MEHRAPLQVVPPNSDQISNRRRDTFTFSSPTTRVIGPTFEPTPGSLRFSPIRTREGLPDPNRQDAEAFDLSNVEDQHVALHSTFRPLGRGDQPLLVYLQVLQQNGLKVILIDTTEDLPEDDETTLRSIADHYLRRENTGWDFSSWLSVVSIFPDLEVVAKRIFLLNDSNIGLE